MDLHPTAVKEETGFSVVEMLLCLVIVCLVTFIGLYVYNTQKSANASYKSASAVAQAPVPKITKKAPAGTTASTAQPTYLTIKEWGVRMQLPVAIKDADYSIRQENGQANYFAGLSTASLTKLSAQCAANSTTLGALVRQTSAEHDANVVASSKSGSTIYNPVYNLKVGTYYYAFIHAQAACYDQNNAAAASYYETVKPDALLKSAVDTLELSS